MHVYPLRGFWQAFQGEGKLKGILGTRLGFFLKNFFPWKLNRPFVGVKTLFETT